jgi:WD40 repeat protein
MFTLSDALDAVYTLAFHPSGKQLSAAGAEKLIHTWDLTPDGGTLARSTIAHEDSILQIAYSPDGRTLASTAADRLIKIWDVEKGTEIKVLDAQKDWALALVFSPDGSLLAVGRYDGSVSLYDTAKGIRKLDPKRALRNAPMSTRSGLSLARVGLRFRSCRKLITSAVGIALLILWTSRLFISAWLR